MFGLLGALVNTVTVLVGGSIGLLLKKGIPQHIGDTMMKGLGHCFVLELRKLNNRLLFLF